MKSHDKKKIKRLSCFHYGVFPLPDSYADLYSDSYPDNMQKGSTGTDYYENYSKTHLIGTDISVKLGTIPICIGVGTGRSSVEIVLHINILAIGIGNGIGIGVGQWKHTITSCKLHLLSTRMHSSRMRTGRALTVSRGGCLPAGGGGACLPGGGACRGGVADQPPPENLEQAPPPCGQNHRHL